jgi:Flp pilus assembly protein TadD
MVIDGEGTRLQDGRMKRLTGALAAAALAFSLAACSGSGGDDEPTQSILTGVPAPEESILTGVPAPSDE